MFKEWWNVTREETEEIATEMTRKIKAEKRKQEEKFEEIRKFNRKHPVIANETVTVFQSELDEKPKPDYNPANYVLGYLFPDKHPKKK